MPTPNCMRLCRIHLFCWVMVSLSGCANTTHMALYQNTNLGLKGGLNPQNSNVSVKIGFSREFISVIPKVQHEDPAVEHPQEAGSVFAASRVDIQGLNVPEIEEIIVTGDAAVEFARSKEGHDAVKIP